MRLFQNVLNFSAKKQFKTASELFIYHSDYKGALKCIERSLDSDPDNPRALVLYADILFCLERQSESLAILDEVTTKHPNFAEAYISRASIYEALGKPREALEDCNLALRYIHRSKHYLFASVYEQKLTLLISLKFFRATEAVLAEAARSLDWEDYDYLLTIYSRQVRQARQLQLEQRKAVGASMSVITEQPLQLIKF